MAKKQVSKRSKSVEKMCTSFMDLHRQGYSIAQIAKKFHLSTSTVYNYLDKIADENHTTRELLLSRNSSPHSTTPERESYDKLIIEKLFNELETAISITKQLLNELDKLLEEE